MPVITRDVNRQRRQAPSQAPFSDAYLNGMSAKRRRVMCPIELQMNFVLVFNILPNVSNRITYYQAKHNGCVLFTDCSSTEN